MADLDEVTLLDLVPVNLIQDKNVYASSIAIDPELKAVSEKLMVPAIFSRIDDLTSEQLDHIAWQFDSKVWRDSWPLHLKQSVIRTIISEKSKRGTLSAVRNAVESLGSAVIIREWWETSPKGDPYTFAVTLSVNEIPGQVSAQTQADLMLRIDDVKPVRSRYTFSIATQANGGLNLSNGVRVATFTRLKLSDPPEPYYLARPDDGIYLTQTGNYLTIY
jgi:phage tail P2-like protein